MPASQYKDCGGVNRGLSALDLAKELKNKEMIKLLSLNENDLQAELVDVETPQFDF